MIVYNITFHIEPEVLEETLGYLKKTFIPRSIGTGRLLQPCLRRVMHTPEGEGMSYAVQFHVTDTDTLYDWMEQEGAEIQEALVKHFGNKVTGFSTLLEEVDWEQ